jgi:hypothetical protein
MELKDQTKWRLAKARPDPVFKLPVAVHTWISGKSGATCQKINTARFEVVAEPGDYPPAPIPTILSRCLFSNP